MNLELKKFDMSQITGDKVVVLIGKRDTGKSFLCRDILYNHKDVPVGQVISGTEGANQFYSKMVPKLFIHDEFKTNIIENMLKRQKLMIEKINRGDTSVDPRAFLILDDCLYDNTWAKDKWMRSVFMTMFSAKLAYMLILNNSTLSTGSRVSKRIFDLFLKRVVLTVIRATILKQDLTLRP